MPAASAVVRPLLRVPRAVHVAIDSARGEEHHYYEQPGGYGAACNGRKVPHTSRTPRAQSVTGHCSLRGEATAARDTKPAHTAPPERLRHHDDVTEEDAWARAAVLNRELGNRLYGEQDPALDSHFPPGWEDGFFIAEEVGPGEWHAVFQDGPEDEPGTDGDRFFRRLWRGIQNFFSEILSS